MGKQMRKLSDDDLHILSVVEKHERICIGLPVDPDWAPIAEHLRRLAKWKYLIEDATDDGPAYTLSQAGRESLG
ncbi:hypothetical protein VW29_07450 [Devosia limi DSM 17137]|uniref:Uncharacterized protein n=2 Tax=Devosia limi DSM 17137 TaxID=1121477 RepID=A0A0F5LS17_9HYPH|nr:hypothetical protein [Devosia limi]KKB85160.1 hypothetical protein VW29_07450 [Devosia limi DSM 17137]